MPNSRPTFRIGQAVRLTATPTRDGAEPISALSRDHAVGLARQIMDQIDIVMERLFAAVAADGQITARVERERLGGEDDERLTFSKGVIIDLRNFVVETERFRHRMRCCLTVCQHGSMSKLWFRSHNSGIRDGATFAEPVDQSFRQISDFIGESAVLGEKVLVALQDFYREEIQKYFSDKDELREVSLTPEKEFRFQLFDTGAEELRLVTDELDKGESFTSLVKELTKHQDAKLNPAALATLLAVGEDHDEKASIQHALTTIKDDDHFEIVSKLGLAKDLGLLIHKREGNASSVETFTGAAISAATDPKARSDSPSPGFRLSAEMLARVAHAL